LGLSFEHINNRITHHWGASVWVFYLSTSTIALLITKAVLLGLSFEHINNRITHYWGGSFWSFI
jgi:hypothetical protein